MTPRKSLSDRYRETRPREGPVGGFLQDYKFWGLDLANGDTSYGAGDGKPRKAGDPKGFLGEGAYAGHDRILFDEGANIIAFPGPQTTPIGQATQICVTIDVTATVQWQISSDCATNWTNITDGGDFSGSNTACLTFTPVDASLNGSCVRVVVDGNASGPISLTVGGTCLATGLNCRVRGGTATLIGYSEFVSPSTPPKKYRKKAFSGRNDRCNFNSAADCNAGTPIQGSDASVFGLTCQYDKTTGLLSSTGLNQTLQNFGTCPASTLLSTSTDCSANLTAGTQVGVTQTQTSQARYVIGQCILSGSVYSQVTTSLKINLSDEDLETDAIARLLAGAGGTWGAWTAPGSLGCTGSPASCCLAEYEQRTSAFSFAYDESQARVQVSGLANGMPYYTKFGIYRSVHGANTYSLYQTQVVGANADITGTFTATIDVPNDEGYDTYAALIAC